MESKDYRASIKVVGTVLPDTKLILKKYRELKDIELLKKEVLDNNLILKTSRRRAETIFYELRKRYLYDQLNGYKENSFIYFLKKIDSDSIINLLLYYYLCKEERIIYEYIVNLVYEKYYNGSLGITSVDTKKFILDLAEKDENVSKWSERTINDVRSGMMGVLKEFGFINSRKRPRFNKPFIPSIIFYYVLYMNKDNVKTVEDVYKCKDLHLFLLLESDINILLEEAYRNGVLDFGREEPKTLIYKYKDIKEIIDGYVNGEIQ
jgi:hypothetical protein